MLYSKDPRGYTRRSMYLEDGHIDIYKAGAPKIDKIDKLLGSYGSYGSIVRWRNQQSPKPNESNCVDISTAGGPQESQVA